MAQFYNRQENLTRLGLGKSGSSLFEYYGFTKKDERRYPVISRILKELTPEIIKKEVQAIQAIKLPPELQKWMRAYEKVGERDEYIWKWAYWIAQIVTLSGISRKYQRNLSETKFLMIMLTVLLDDIADKMQSKILLENIQKIFFKKNTKFNQVNKKEKNYLKFSIRVLQQIQKYIKKYPQYKEFHGIFEFDVNQVLNTIKYSYLVNRNPYLINKTEYWLYLPHNMLFMVHFTIDLMCAPRFKFEELGMLRSVAHEAQKMGRVCNWISTWEKEIREKDFTSGVFAYAIEKNIWTPGEFYRQNKNEIIKKIKKSDIVFSLLKEWEWCYNKIKTFDKKMKYIEIKKLLRQLEYFLIADLISVGYK